MGEAARRVDEEDARRARREGFFYRGLFSSSEFVCSIGPVDASLEFVRSFPRRASRAAPPAPPVDRRSGMLDKLGKDAAARKFVRAYDKYTIALCGTALLAYGAQQYFVASPARPVPPPRASIGSRARDSIPPDAHPPGRRARAARRPN